MSTTKPLAVIAFGGNALVPDAGHLSLRDQYPVIERLSATLADIILSGWRVVITHGNGPQVGVVMRRVELTRDDAAPVTLDYAVSYTQGSIGSMFSLALTNELHRRGQPARVTALITHTVVNADDGAFAAPRKPIGSWYDEGTARRLAAECGWSITEDSGRGWRRTVPSPRPVAIAQLDAVRTLLEQDVTVIALGGGGVPVVLDGGGYRGVEAVVDKDFATSLLARNLDADLLLFPTAVPRVAVGFNTPSQRWLDVLDVDEARRLLAAGEFPPGSMAPKVTALLEFVEATGKPGVITDIQHLRQALAGTAGTRMVRQAPLPAPLCPDTSIRQSF